MRKNIVVCCEKMLDALTEPQPCIAVVDSCDVLLEDEPIHFCPWCGKELPFPYDEEPDAD